MSGVDFIRQIIERSGGKIPSLPDFEPALVGFQNSPSKSLRPVYDFDRCIELLVEQGLSEKDAIDELIREMEAYPDACMVTIVRDAFCLEDEAESDEWSTLSGTAAETQKFTFNFTEEDPETEKLK